MEKTSKMSRRCVVRDPPQNPFDQTVLSGFSEGLEETRETAGEFVWSFFFHLEIQALARVKKESQRIVGIVGSCLFVEHKQSNSNGPQNARN